MRDVERRDGAVRIGPGILYRTIKRLLADGPIEEVTGEVVDDVDAERRRYGQETGAGEQVAAAELTRPRTLVACISKLRPDFGPGFA